jgi:hypothetical protein
MPKLKRPSGTQKPGYSGIPMQTSFITFGLLCACTACITCVHCFVVSAFAWPITMAATGFRDQQCRECPVVRDNNTCLVHMRGMYHGVVDLELPVFEPRVLQLGILRPTSLQFPVRETMGRFNLLDQLTFYGSYHSNKWNKLIHLIFVPSIVWCCCVKLAYTGQLVQLPPAVADAIPSWANG